MTPDSRRPRLDAGTSSGTTGPAGAPVHPAGAVGPPAGTSESATSAGTDKLARAADFLPSVSVPKGGGAIRSLDEKFSVNAATGTATMTVPLPLSPGRSGFTPGLQLAYDSGAGNGPFGFGWSLGDPGDHPQDRQGPAALLRRRRVGRLHPGGRGGPGARARPGRQPEDARRARSTAPPTRSPSTARGSKACSPGSSAGPTTDTGISHWRTHLPRQRHHAVRRRPGQQGRRPRRSARIFSWQICRSWDDKGNVAGLQLRRRGRRRHRPGRGARGEPDPAGPRRPDLPQDRPLRQPPALLPRLDGGRGDRAAADWMFSVVLDYGDHASDAARPAARPAAGRCAPTRSPPTAPVRGPHLPPGPAAAVLQQLPRRADGRAPTAWSARSTWSTPTSRRRPTRAIPIYTFLVSVTQTGYRQDDAG